MPTQTPLTDAITALTTYSNTVTGASDTTLSDAVATLASGYGGGGSGWTTDGIAKGSEPSGALTIGLTSSEKFRDRAFLNCTEITSVNAPYVERALGNSVFSGCTKITTASLPNFKETDSRYGGDMFTGCTLLETIDMPYAKPGCSFDGCSSLKSYTNKQTQPANSGFSSYQFRNCSSLEVIDYTYTTQFGCNYNNCTKLQTVVLRRSDAIVPLNNANNVPPTMKTGGSGCTIYVPSALISTYQTATNWSTVYAVGLTTFTAIEGSYYATHYADGSSVS